MSRVLRSRALASVLVALTAVLAVAALAPARTGMQSTKIGPLLCETTGGGKFVSLPQFPGEKIDRRLLRDVKYLERHYKIFVTDGYSMSDVHSLNGEHPIGLALDIVPNKAAGGSWTDIDRLARWAEPRQNQPRSPFRWVGYDGDAGHGRGHHLHLSYNHGTSSPGRPVRTIYSLRCPERTGTGTVGSDEPTEPKPPKPPTGGGVDVSGGGDDDIFNTGSGGLGGKLSRANPVIETDGVDLGE